MFECGVCGEVCGNKGALGSHMRHRHPEPVQGGTRTEALEATLQCLRAAGRLEPVDAARVDVLRGLAAAVEAKPYEPGLWREYRAALSEVLDADSAADDDLAEAVAAIRQA